MFLRGGNCRCGSRGNIFLGTFVDTHGHNPVRGIGHAALLVEVIEGTFHQTVIVGDPIVLVLDCGLGGIDIVIISVPVNQACVGRNAHFIVAGFAVIVHVQALLQPTQLIEIVGIGTADFDQTVGVGGEVASVPHGGLRRVDVIVVAVAIDQARIGGLAIHIVADFSIRIGVQAVQRGGVGDGSAALDLLDAVA